MPLAYCFIILPFSSPLLIGKDCHFHARTGYCNGSNSIVNGSGLNNSTAGEIAYFSVYLNDIYHYPSPVEVERLQVEIVREIDSYGVQPTIYPIQIVNGTSNLANIFYCFLLIKLFGIILRNLLCLNREYS